MDKLKKTMAGIGAIAVVAGSIVAEDVYHKDIYLKANDKMYSGMEYRQERKAIGSRASADNLDFDGLQLYIEILNREKDRCDNKMYPINSKQDIRDQVKKFDKNGCPR